MDNQDLCKAVLMLDNIAVLFYPPNVKNWYHLMEMGVVTCFKVVQCAWSLEYFIRFFTVEEGYDSLKSWRSRVKPVCRCRCVVGNLMVLDLMEFSAEIWDNNTNYDY